MADLKTLRDERKKARREESMPIATMNLYGFYHVGIFMAILLSDTPWPSWEIGTVVVIFVLSLTVTLSRPFDAHTRGAIYSICVLSNITIFSLHSNNLNADMVQFVVIVIVMGTCGYKDYTNIAAGFFAITLAAHIFVTKSIDITSSDSLYHSAIISANVILAIIIVHEWVKIRTRRNDELAAVIEDLKITEASKDDFMANVSHEIRTPINTISGMSDILMNENDPGHMREEIHSIQMAGQSLMGVVSDILDFSELQAGHIELVEEAYDSTSAMNDLINSARALYEKSNLEFVVDIDQTMPRTLMGDERKIRRIAMNLLSNAFKFTKEGGVTLSLRCRKESYGINLILSVSDTGIGMDEKSVEHLFETYNQVDTSRARKEGGIGLGISITTALIAAMGGVITVKSKLGKGTTMQVTIPQRVIDDRPIIHLENPEEYGVLIYLGKEKIKMTEMRDSYGNMVDHMVEQFGVRAHFCTNLAEVKRRLEREKCTHLFLSMLEYREEPDFFDNLAKEIAVVILTEPGEHAQINQSNLLYIEKPMYALPVMTVLNGSRNNRVINREVRSRNFIAPGVNILVVDDNAMNIKVMAGLLRKYQIQVTQALSGFEAINKIYDLKYDMIFMDHMMPEMDGVETLKCIRAKGDSFCTSVPIIAVTANAVAGAREMLIGSGFNDFLEKPVEVSTLEHLLLRMIPEEKIVYLKEEEPKEQKKAEEQSRAKQPNQMVVLHQYIPETEGSPSSAEPVAEPVAESSADTFAVGDLDVEMGMSYCGGQEAYLMILEEYAQKKERNWEDIEAQFAARDWKNYIITVHGIKSSMKTIGAMPLSEMAKALELKGKEGDYEYILQNHAEMLAEYKRVVGEILAYPEFAKYADAKETQELLPEIAEDCFDGLLQDFENAMFELDGDKMSSILDELGKYSCNGKNLKDVLQTVRHKVEMSDYMSASETLVQEKMRLKK